MGIINLKNRDVISNIVDLCLKYNAQTRADVKEI